MTISFYVPMALIWSMIGIFIYFLIGLMVEGYLGKLYKDAYVRFQNLRLAGTFFEAGEIVLADTYLRRSTAIKSKFLETSKLDYFFDCLFESKVNLFWIVTLVKFPKLIRKSQEQADFMEEALRYNFSLAQKPLERQ